MTTHRMYLLFVVVLALLTTACGGAPAADTSEGVPTVSDGAGGFSESDSSVPGVDDSEGAPLAFAQCMRQEGVEDFPDPQEAEGGISVAQEFSEDPDFDQARRACEPLLFAGGEFEPPDERQAAEIQAHALEFAQCMRDHDIDYSDPEFMDGGMIRLELGEDVNPDDPAFQQAQSDCGSPVPDLDEHEFVQP